MVRLILITTRHSSARAHFEATYGDQATVTPVTAKPATSSSGNGASGSSGTAGSAMDELTDVKNGSRSPLGSNSAGSNFTESQEPINVDGDGVIDYTRPTNRSTSGGSEPSSQRTSASKSGTDSIANPKDDAVKVVNGPVLVPVTATSAGCMVFALAIFTCQKYGKKTGRKDDDSAKTQTHLIAATPSAEMSSSVTPRGDFGLPPQEYLANDVRNDRSLDGFRLELRDLTRHSQIARGGPGVINHGSFLGRDVAIKQMLPATGQDDRSLGSFMNEIRLCAKLDHPRIVSLVGVVWSSLRDLSVLIEFMPGGDLEAQLQKQPVPASPQDWLEPWTASRIKAKTLIAKDITEAIVYLHSLNSPVLHRDLKAKNVLLDLKGNAKLSDFGISRELSVDLTMTREVGTFAWIAPEVLRGERYDEKADIYSLGVVLVEMDRCRQPRFENSETLAKMASTSDSVCESTQFALRIGAVELRPSVTRECPAHIAELVERCVRYNPEERPAAMEVHYELRQE